MGLKSGPNGAKATLRARFPSAFRETSSLLELRTIAGVDRAQTTAALDGNVALMNSPNATFEESCQYVARTIFNALETAALVVVVFDEPETMTGAKKEEQMRRDGAALKKNVICSLDIKSPHNDNFTIAQLTSVACIRDVIKHRAARNRLYDSIMARVAEIIRPTLDLESNVLIDGLDRRGCARPFGSSREPAMISVKEDKTLEEAFAHYSEGEGDIKLQIIANRVRELSSGRALHISATIDTDSIAIGLMDQARRVEESDSTKVIEVLAMRERGKKDENGNSAPGYYTCVDFSVLYSFVCKDLHSQVAYITPTPGWARKAIALLMGGLILCGCDYVEVKGMKVEHVFAAVPRLLGGAQRTVDSIQDLWSGDTAQTKSVVLVLRNLVDLCADSVENTPRSRKTTVQQMRSSEQALLMRAVWVLAYWNEHEFENVAEFGFNVLSG